MIVLVTGGRDFSDYGAVCSALALLPEINMIIEGGARGADSLARRWAKANGVHFATVPALWDCYKKSRRVLTKRRDAIPSADTLHSVSGRQRDGGYDSEM